MFHLAYSGLDTVIVIWTALDIAEKKKVICGQLLPEFSGQQEAAKA
jgi:hypothetical protein